MIEINNTRTELLTQVGLEILFDRYLLPNETPQDMFVRVSEAYCDDEAHAQRLYDYMSKLWFMPATPILCNGGTSRGLPISCFLQTVGDSMKSINDNWHESTALASKGGGLGVYYGDVRSIGERVGVVGETCGVIPFIKVNDAKTLAVSQGNLRRGSAAVYLPVWHGDIEEFIEIREPSGGDPNRKSLNIHHGVVIDDKFMEAVESDSNYDLISPNTGASISTIKARELWIKILETRLETGEPYILWNDRVIEATPEHHKQLELFPKQSNLCVAPETKILTKKGYYPIGKLKDCEMEVWNGTEWSEVKIRKTGKNQPLIKVAFSDGSEIECTKQHKFYIQNEYHQKATVVEADKLVIGDKLEKWDLPTDVKFRDRNVTDVEYKNPDIAYSQGFYTGDGNTGLNYSWLYSTKYCCKSKLVGTFSDEHKSSKRVTWKHGVMKDKFFVPDNDYGKSYCFNWLAGLFDADGTVVKSNNGDTLQLASINPSFLLDVKRLLETMGVNSKISLAREEGSFELPNGKGGLASYNCKEINRLLIATAGTKRLLILGLDCMRLEFNSVQEPQRDAQRFVQVVSVTDSGRVSDTYCATEPKRGRLCFNGIVTGNCSEITLPTNEERTAVCCLSSLNLETYDQWKDNTYFIEDVMRFLDNVLTSFINKAHSSMGKAIFSAFKERSVGLGTMGFHSYLQSKNIPFDSVLAKSFNMNTFKRIKEQVEAANTLLAYERGACPDAEEFGINKRFSYTMAIAPNANISLITGGTSYGIEPIAGNYYSLKTLSGTFFIKNKYLDNLIKEKYSNKYDEIWKAIGENEGSISTLDYFTDEEKEVFKTAFEIDQRYIITHAADRQPYIDQAQSLNIFLPSNIDKQSLWNIHMDAWKLGLKTMYYLRSKSIRRSEKVSLTISTTDECLSCN